MTTTRMGEEGFRWFVGIVEDIKDPDMLGRVKVRVIGEHDDPKIQTDELHWATPILPPIYASYKQIGRSPTGIEVGSHVFGFFMDGHEKQIPLIWGTYAKMPGKKQENNDVPDLARENNTVQKEQLGPEPESAYAAKYPFNHVWKTKSGHIIEVDDSPDAERLHVYHKSGSYVEINTDGRVVSKTVDDDIEIVVKDKTVYVKGECNITVLGNCNITSDHGVRITAPAGLTVEGSITATGTISSAVGCSGTFTSPTGQTVQFINGMLHNIN
jgi:hypothetical protein